MLGQIDAFIAFAVVILGVSLLITVLNQALVAVLSLRGTNLQWGLRTLLECVDPRLKKHSKEIGEAVLRHPMISDSTWSRTGNWPVIGWFVSRWKLASAIRVEELKGILESLAASSSAPWKADLAAVLEEDRKREAKRLADAKAALADVMLPGQSKLADVAPQVARQVKRAVGDVELWFDSVMDRVSQRFSAYLRVSTVVFAVLIAFVLHLDASRLLRQIQADPQLRTRLVASTDAMTRHAERVLVAAVPDATATALSRLHAESEELRKLPPPGSGTITRTAARGWIADQKIPDERKSELLARLDVLIRDETKSVLGDLRETAASIEGTLESAGLQLIPNYAQHRLPDGWPDWWFYGTGSDHFLGILFSAVLLSLGAPFWFSVLKSAATLRPIIATKESSERERSRS